MGYSGAEEYLCARGHYQKLGHWLPAVSVCGLHGCSAPIKWHHTIDHTNGYDEMDASTFPAAKVEVGWDDISHYDHYGNKYFSKQECFEPAVGSAWEIWILHPSS